MHLKENRIAFSFIKQAYCTFEKCIRMSNFSGFLHAANGKAARKTANLSKLKLFLEKREKHYIHIYIFQLLVDKFPNFIHFYLNLQQKSLRKCLHYQTLILGHRLKDTLKLSLNYAKILSYLLSEFLSAVNEI